MKVITYSVIILKVTSLALALGVEELFCVLAVGGVLLPSEFSIARRAHSFRIMFSILVFARPDLDHSLPIRIYLEGLSLGDI